MAARYTYYRQFFTIELKHSSIPESICEYFELEPTAKTKQLLLDKKMRYKVEPGMISIYYSGTADPSNTPPIIDDKMIPYASIENNTEFIFIIRTTNTNILKKTNIPSPETTPGFNIKETAKAIPWHYIQQSIFGITFSSGASANVFESYLIKDDKGKVVYTGSTKKNNQGQFPCTADLSLHDSGFYSIELGTKKKLFYLDRTSEMNNSYGFIRVIKDNTWSTPRGIYDAAKYNVFNYEFPEANYAITL